MGCFLLSNETNVLWILFSPLLPPHLSPCHCEMQVVLFDGLLLETRPSEVPYRKKQEALNHFAFFPLLCRTHSYPRWVCVGIGFKYALNLFSVSCSWLYLMTLFLCLVTAGILMNWDECSYRMDF